MTTESSDPGGPPPPTSGWVLPSDGQPSRWPGTGTVIRRTATVVVSAPKSFLAIAALAAIPSLATVLVTPAQAERLDIARIVLSIAVGLAGVVWSFGIGALTIFATAEVAGGRRVHLRRLVGATRRPVVAQVVAAIALLAVAVVIGAALFGISVLAHAPALAVIAGLAVAVFGIVAVLRLSLILPAIVLESRGGIDAIGRSWDVTHSLTWRLLWYYMAVGLLLGLPALAVQAATVLSPSPEVSIGVAVMVAPLGIVISIASAILFGHLIGRPWTLPDRVPRAVAMTVLVAVLSAVGVVAISAVAVTRLPMLAYMTDRTAGQVQFGRAPAPTETCHVGSQDAAFGAQDSVYVSAVFLVPAGNGIPVIRELSRNGIVVSTTTIALREFTSCYVERVPLANLTPGTYRLTFREQRFIVADGGFVLKGSSTETSRVSDGQTRSGYSNSSVGGRSGALRRS